MRIITLLTDFGTADHFVGAVKGVILSETPEARIVDLTHEIPAHDIEAAAFTLLASYPSFPVSTVHVAVVDPGVGSARRGICVAAGEQLFVGPDNGIFSYIYDREPGFRIFELTNRRYFGQPVSSTFHGRDVFAPVAAALASGTRPEDLGRELSDPVRLAPLSAEVIFEKKTLAEIRGRVIHIDRFGNCITNITPRELTPKFMKGGAYLRVKGHKIQSFRTFFAEESDTGPSRRHHSKRNPPASDLFGIWGSAGFMEIAATNRSAAKLLKVTRGEAVVVKTSSE